MIYSNSSALPRQEIAAVIREGRNVNRGNIGLQVMPFFGIDKRNGHLMKATIANAELLRIMDKIVEPGANIERITLSFTDTTLTLALRKEEVKIPDEVELDYADYFSTEAFAAQTGADKLELTHEYLVAAALFNTTTFGAATNSSVAYTEANIATIAPVSDILASIERVQAKGEQPDTVVIPQDVFRRIRRSADMLNFVRGSTAAKIEVTTNTLQAAFADEGITQVLIGRSRYNNAARGATPSLVRIWSNSYIWVGASGNNIANEDGISTVDGVGATLFWKPYGGPWEVQTYREEAVESNIVRCKTSITPYVANSRAGDLIGTQYS